MALTFRQRIFAWLVVIAVVPATIAVVAAVYSPRFAAPVGGAEAWERTATSWRMIRHSLDTAALRPVVSGALARHEEELSRSLLRARQAEAIQSAFAGALAAAAIALAVLVGGGAVRLAGHLSRQLSRPMDELLQWTHLIERGDPLPQDAATRGAPEFEVLRRAFRRMSAELERARAREVEAAELRAFRALSAQVAHELKNPLTPMRFALARLAKSARAEDRELVEVLELESARLERMARDFGELGRLPEGPTAVIDLAELCASLAGAATPEGVRVRTDAAEGIRVRGRYEPLRRAVHNLVLNAIDATGEGGEVLLAVRAGNAHASLTVSDTGKGIAPEALPRIFEPYFTTKAHGTGLGLALARQTVHDHGGTIEVESGPGGTAFTITLPVERS